MSENRSWGHAVLPLDSETRKRDDEVLAGIRTRLIDVPCLAVQKCEVTLRRRAIGGWSEERLAVDDHWHREWVDGDSEPSWTWCSRKCHERREFIVRYAYVTGRAGRTSDAERRVCRKHAEAFAKKYGIAMPTAVPA